MKNILLCLLLIGRWENDECNGLGIYFYKNGDIYEGEWKNNMRYG